MKKFSKGNILAMVGCALAAIGGILSNAAGTEQMKEAVAEEVKKQTSNQTVSNEKGGE